MKHTFIFIIIVISLLTACHDDNDSPAVETPPTNNPGNTGPNPMTPPDDGTVNFNAFMRGLLNSATDTAEPVDIDSITFSPDANEQSFNDLF